MRTTSKRQKKPKNHYQFEPSSPSSLRINDPHTLGSSHYKQFLTPLAEKVFPSNIRFQNQRSIIDNIASIQERYYRKNKSFLKRSFYSGTMMSDQEFSASLSSPKKHQKTISQFGNSTKSKKMKSKGPISLSLLNKLTFSSNTASQIPGFSQNGSDIHCTRGEEKTINRNKFIRRNLRGKIMSKSLIDIHREKLNDPMFRPTNKIRDYLNKAEISKKSKKKKIQNCPLLIQNSKKNNRNMIACPEDSYLMDKKFKKMLFIKNQKIAKKNQFSIRNLNKSSRNSKNKSMLRSPISNTRYLNSTKKDCNSNSQLKSTNKKSNLKQKATDQGIATNTDTNISKKNLREYRKKYLIQQQGNVTDFGLKYLMTDA